MRVPVAADTERLLLVGADTERLLLCETLPMFAEPRVFLVLTGALLMVPVRRAPAVVVLPTADMGLPI